MDPGEARPGQAQVCPSVRRGRAGPGMGLVSVCGLAASGRKGLSVNCSLPPSD